MAERRKSMRFAAFLDVDFNVMGNSPVQAKCRSKDLSGNGLGVYGDLALAKGVLVKLEIRIPGNDTPIVALCEVVWSGKASNYCYYTGMRFKNIEDLDKCRLLYYGYDELLKTKSHDKRLSKKLEKQARREISRAIKDNTKFRVS